jgi:hypothetical protein
MYLGYREFMILLNSILSFKYHIISLFPQHKNLSLQKFSREKLERKVGKSATSARDERNPLNFPFSIFLVLRLPFTHARTGPAGFL